MNKIIVLLGVVALSVSASFAGVYGYGASGQTAQAGVKVNIEEVCGIAFVNGAVIDGAPSINLALTGMLTGNFATSQSINFKAAANFPFNVTASAVTPPTGIDANDFSVTGFPVAVNNPTIYPISDLSSMSGLSVLLNAVPSHTLTVNFTASKVYLAGDHANGSVTLTIAKQ